MRIMELAGEDMTDLHLLQRQETFNSGPKRREGAIAESTQVNTVIESPLNFSPGKAKKIEKALQDLSSISIMEMLNEVRGLWFELD